MRNRNPLNEFSYISIVKFVDMYRFWLQSKNSGHLGDVTRQSFIEMKNVETNVTKKNIMFNTHFSIRLMFFEICEQSGPIVLEL